jgi:hypothetical protein
MFTDNSTAESAFFKGTSKNPELFELVLKVAEDTHVWGGDLTRDTCGWEKDDCSGYRWTFQGESDGRSVERRGFFTLCATTPKCTGKRWPNINQVGGRLVRLR